LTCVDTWSGKLNRDGGSLSDQAPVMILGCARRLVEAGISANVRLIPAMTGDAARVWSWPIDFLYAWDEYERTYGLTLTRYQSDPPASQGIQLIYGRTQGWKA
jgi:hypothetical protein